MSTLSQQLAEFAVSTPIPDGVRTSVAERILDILGIAVAATTLSTSRAAIEWVASNGGTPRATAIGIGDDVPAPMAAFVNGTLAHSLDYDDTHLPSILHPSAAVIPAALAAAQHAGSTGLELVDAVAVGLEVCVRTGMAGYDTQLNNSAFFERGQHATSICGSLGGAVAASRLYSGDAQRVADSLGVVASMASGIIEANRTGGTVKRLHCGWAAHSAVSAADLVERGFTGAPTVLEGRFGFYSSFLDGRYDATQITNGLGSEWSVPGIFFKPYPANHFTHCAADAAIQLRESGLVADDIRSVRIGVATPTVRTIGEPIDTKRNPQTGYQAQFSGPYVFAAAFLGGTGLGLGLADFTDELAIDPRRVDLMSKITVEADAKCDGIYPHQFPAVVHVELVDGSTRTIEVLANRGGNERPLTDLELAQKFRDNASPVVGTKVSDSVIDACSRIESLDNVNPLIEPLRTAGLVSH